jgi:hypothetical protein
MYTRFVVPTGAHADSVLGSAEPESVDIVCRLISERGPDRAEATR